MEKEKTRLPLQPYKDAYSFEFIGTTNFNNALNQEDDMERAVAESKKSYNSEYSGLDEAIRQSIADQTITIDDDPTPTRAKAPTRATARTPTIIALLSPVGTGKGTSISTPPKTVSGSK